MQSEIKDPEAIGVENPDDIFEIMPNGQKILVRSKDSEMEKAFKGTWKVERFIKPETLYMKIFRFAWWIFFTVCVIMILRKVLSGENQVEFNFGGMPLN